MDYTHGKIETYRTIKARTPEIHNPTHYNPIGSNTTAAKPMSSCRNNPPPRCRKLLSVSRGKIRCAFQKTLYFPYIYLKAA